MFLSQFDYLLDLRNRRLEFGAHGSAAGIKAPFRTVEGRPVVVTNLGSLVVDSGVRQVIRFGVRGIGETREMITASGSARVNTLFSRLSIEGRTFWRGGYRGSEFSGNGRGRLVADKRL
jgi:hypothetical protein